MVLRGRRLRRTVQDTPNKTFMTTLDDEAELFQEGEEET